MRAATDAGTAYNVWLLLRPSRILTTPGSSLTRRRTVSRPMPHNSASSSSDSAVQRRGFPVTSRDCDTRSGHELLKVASGMLSFVSC